MAGFFNKQKQQAPLRVATASGDKQNQLAPRLPFDNKATFVQDVKAQLFPDLTNSKVIS